MSVKVLRSAVSVECIFLYADWRGLKLQEDCRCGESRVRARRSSSLESVERLEIGR